MSFYDNKITRFTEYYNTIDLTICTTGQQFAATKVDGPYAPEFHVLHYVTAGKGTLEIAGKKYTVSKGDIFSLHENVECKYFGDQSDPYTYYWVSFRGKYGDYLLKKCNITPQNPIVSVNQANVERLFKNMFRDLKKNNLTSSLKLLSHLYALFAVLIQNVNETMPAPHYLIEKALTYLEQNFNKKITITDVCKHLNCDRAYFTKLFKRQTEYSPKDYLQNLRLSHSKTLLKQTNKSVEQISEECGMEYISFMTAFKKKYGYTPTQYRKRKQEGKKEEKRIIK